MRHYGYTICPTGNQGNGLRLRIRNTVLPHTCRGWWCRGDESGDGHTSQPRPQSTLGNCRKEGEPNPGGDLYPAPASY